MLQAVAGGIDDERVDGVDYDRAHVDEEKDQEKQEIFVVSVAKAVVHKVAMVVKLLNTAMAEVAMGSILRS